MNFSPGRNFGAPTGAGPSDRRFARMSAYSSRCGRRGEQNARYRISGGEDQKESHQGYDIVGLWPRNELRHEGRDGGVRVGRERLGNRG